MVLYLIGLGLGDEKDITIRGYEAIKNCDILFLEYYTSILGVNKEALEAYYKKKIIIADRNMVESSAADIYMPAKDKNVGFLVVGDPLCATTHTDLILRAKELEISVEVIHNTSIMAGVATCGLQLYKYGYTVSIPYFEGAWRPSSFYDRIKYNMQGGMHTLCLLDIKVKEIDYNSIARGERNRLFPPRFMTVNTAISQLLEIEEEKKEGVISRSTLAVGLARVGQRDQMLRYGTLDDLIRVDFGAPLHSLVVCGEIHPLETEILKYISVQVEDLTMKEKDLRKLRLDYDPAIEDDDEDDGQQLP